MNAENDRKTLLSNYYKAKEQIINSENDIDKKYYAWKQQALAISQLFKDNINNKIKNGLLERHCKQQQLLFDSGVFMKLRLKNVENLLDIESAVIENALSPSDTERALPDINNMTVPHAQEQDFHLNLSQLNVWSSSSTVTVNKTFHEKQNTGTREKFMQREPIKDNSSKKGEFTTARQLLLNRKQITTFCSLASQENQNESKSPRQPFFNYGLSKKSLSVRNIGNVNKIGSKSSKDEDAELNSLMMHPALKTVDIKMVEMITNEIIQKFKAVDWHEIAGLDYAKSVIKEAVVYPLLRPDIFTGLRRPPRGILLFGPPGTGKTLIGKCIASQSKSTFFCISASSLTSKWMGESEKLVRALFAVAEARQPSIIFLDEVDSLLTQRFEAENECTRRLKTEFLVRLDGASTSDNERILIVGATNRPHELDEAVRRRFTKRLYVALPVIEARLVILQNLLQMVNHDISLTELQKIAELTEGYSGADMDSLCRESSMEPLRAIPFEAISTFNENNLRAVNFIDFQNALDKIRPSVSTQDLQQYINWNKTYGSTV